LLVPTDGLPDGAAGPVEEGAAEGAGFAAAGGAGLAAAGGAVGLAAGAVGVAPEAPEAPAGLRTGGVTGAEDTTMAGTPPESMRGKTRRSCF